MAQALRALAALPEDTVWLCVGQLTDFCDSGSWDIVVSSGPCEHPAHVAYINPHI